MGRNTWSQKQIDYLKENFKNMTDEKLSKELSKFGEFHSKNAVERKRASLSLFKDLRYSLNGINDDIAKEILNSKCSYKEACMMFCPKYNLSTSQIEYFYKKNHLRVNKTLKWSDEECTYILNHYKSVSIVDMSKTLNRTLSSVAYKLRALGISLNDCVDYQAIPDKKKSEREWSDDEIKFLKRNIEYLTYKEIAKRLNKSEKAVMVKATKMSLIRTHTSWSKIEEEILVSNSNLSIYDLVFLLQRSEKSIKHKANELGIRVSKRRNSVLFTEPERKVQYILSELNIPFTTHERPLVGSNYEVDIMLNNKICIEIQGDYWHGNPKLFPVLDITQQIHKQRDEIKKNLLEKQGYRVIYFWESDINTDLENIKNTIVAVLGQDSQKTQDD